MCLKLHVATRTAGGGADIECSIQVAIRGGCATDPHSTQVLVVDVQPGYTHICVIEDIEHVGAELKYDALVTLKSLNRLKSV